MRIRKTGTVLGGLALGALLSAAAWQAAGTPPVSLLAYGCGDAEDRLGDALAGEPVLATAPDGARVKESYRSCDDDDLFVVAGTSYAYDGTRGTALAHLRADAAAQGWRDGAGTCLTKRVGGTTAYLTLEGPDDGTLWVELVADRDNSDWC
ncbi:hypothetical protein [Streptomyces daghestanicus]|uniref:Secreted protein n=1 Tax=Streptomyces daghestanicus TaxID=66885 RepID=A0ABQ3Q6C6_9ACTN|nr:hypothetical protein [Streptomyces daghestanicus]GGU32239.1 hypothetical protein GCM10010259_23480 [Streptomyces daghestanicus]GHI32786.1 hypothetical protein Sdagh_45160 [Streptomyces daghestanicus]